MSDMSTILAVDDTLASLKLLTGVLTAEGYQVRPADSGELALASVAAYPPDLILLDIRMPGLDGFEVFQQLQAREATRAVPVIFLSAATEVKLRVEGLKLGAVDFISKPFQAEELLARVHLHLELQRLRAGLEQQAANLRQAYAELKVEMAERKQAEAALQQYSEQLAEMVEARTRELREAQTQLVRRGKLAVLGQMSGGIAHELRQPLAVISNAVYFLQAAQPDAAPVIREYLGLVDAEVQTADHIITDLLSFAHARTAEQEPADLAGLVDQALARNPAPKGIAVQIALPPDLPPVYVDPRQMGQVLNNLVTNAYQAMPRGGQVALTAAPAATGFVSLAVADTGDGIAPENLPKLFEPLFTTKTKGIGLGLTVTKMLVEANGGTINVTSETGRGAAFHLTLPIKEEPV